MYLSARIVIKARCRWYSCMGGREGGGSESDLSHLFSAIRFRGDIGKGPLFSVASLGQQRLVLALHFFSNPLVAHPLLRSATPGCRQPWRPNLSSIYLCEWEGPLPHQSLDLHSISERAATWQHAQVSQHAATWQHAQVKLGQLGESPPAVILLTANRSKSREHLGASGSS